MTFAQDIEALLPAMAGRAAWLDAASAFPAEDIEALRRAGALAATVPGETQAVLGLMLRLGRANLSVARLVEAHVNALRLVLRFGDEGARAAAAADAAAGHLFGLWVTDAGAAVAADGDVLQGRKGPCSGAGHCTRALVTAAVAGETRMGVIALDGREALVPVGGMQGMRAATNGVVDLGGVRVRHWVGGADAYLREPEFSCGAWRASAAAAGALAGLVAAVATVLRRRGQTEAPMQVARFGEMVTARETARLWVERMAAAGEGGEDEAPVVTVNIGRGAVERACLEGIVLAQRSVGMGAFVAPEPAERIGRDLATYLRQPAVDAVLLEAGAWHLARG